MADDLSRSMNAEGNFIAQAKEGGTASVNVQYIYNTTGPSPIDPETITKGLQYLDKLPLDIVPEPTVLPQGSRLGYARNHFFVGREKDLKELAHMLKSGGSAAIGQVTAATGLGGIGKTQLASEFAHRYGQYFTGGVFWLNFPAIFLKINRETR